MDFGSSHVYVGSEETYYSSVPKESSGSLNGQNISSSNHGQRNLIDNTSGDPVYESIERHASSNTSRTSGNSATNGTVSSGGSVKHKPAVLEKPAFYRSTSLSDKLRKAVHERKQGLEGPRSAPQAPAGHEYDFAENVGSPDAPPLPPRLSDISTGTPQLPPRKPTKKKDGLNKINPTSLYQSGAILQPTLIPTTATDAKLEPAVTVPLIKPPPASLRKRSLKRQSSTSSEQSQVSVDGANDVALKSSQDIPVTTELKSNNINLAFSNSADQPGSKEAICGRVSAEPAWDSVDFLDAQQSALPNNYHQFQSSAPAGLYPTLPSLDEDVTNPSAPAPSAPELTQTLVREEAAFLQEKLKASFLNNPQSSQHCMTNALPSTNELHPTAATVRPSAPSLSQSMKIRDRQRVQARAQVERPDPAASVYSCADTNVVCVKLGIVGQPGSSPVVYGAPVQCSVCHASSQTQTEEWVCRFCLTKNISSAPHSSIPACNDAIYVLRPSMMQNASSDSIIVFCIDTSGSMCVTSEVGSASGKLFISRLESVKEAIHEQLNRISLKKPYSRVALVTFSDVVMFLGDGSDEQRKSLADMELFDYDFLRHIGSSAPLPGPIGATKLKLDFAVSNLKERGGTALGPALLLSSALASQRPGSQVIVCTDGRANIGIGSLETQSDYEMCHHFYEQATELASQTGVIVSILSIAGTDCRLIELGKVASKTSGKVSIVESSKISQEFEDILTDTVLATNVSIDLVTHRQLFFSDSDGVQGSSVSQFVGNITNDTEITFHYGIRKDGEFTSMAPPIVAPFQLRITYRLPDGSVCTRVMTVTRPVTENRELAESEINMAVVGTYASQSAAKLALEGEIDHARRVTAAHEQLLFRGMSLKSESGQSTNLATDEKIYESVSSRIGNIRKELAKVHTESESSDDSLNDVPPIESAVYQEGVFDEREARANAPPDLPPRPTLTSRSSRGPKLSKFPSMSSASIDAMLSKLPSIPKTTLGRKKKNKTKVAMEYKDETAQKIFSFSKVTTGKIAATYSS